MNKLERRYLTQEFRVSQETEAPKIGGYSCVFDSASSDIGWTEFVDKNAFDAVLAAPHDARCLWNHSADTVLGRESSGTLRLSVDARGLAYECDMPETQAAKDLLVSMRRKDVKESSFSFIVARDQWTEMPDGSVQRRILEFAELIDVSPVAFPAFPAATSGVRSLPESMPTEFRSRFEKRTASNGCDCDCPRCEAETCGICSNADCADEQCASCKQQSSRSSQVTAEERCRMEMKLALARLSN
jgi:HK97 family phage prohead protease